MLMEPRGPWVRLSFIDEDPSLNEQGLAQCLSMASDLSTRLASRAAPPRNSSALPASAGPGAKSRVGVKTERWLCQFPACPARLGEAVGCSGISLCPCCSVLLWPPYCVGVGLAVDQRAHPAWSCSQARAMPPPPQPAWGWSPSLCLCCRQAT